MDYTTEDEISQYRKKKQAAYQREYLRKLKTEHPEKYRERMERQNAWRIKNFMLHPEKYEKALEYQREYAKRKREERANNG